MFTQKQKRSYTKHLSFSKLINQYYGQGYELIPIPQEFQLILTDFMNTSFNQSRERMDHIQRTEEKTKTPQPKSVLYYNPLAKDMFQYAKTDLAPKLHEALEAGIPVVVIAGKLEVRDQEDHNYLWLMDLYSGIAVNDCRPAVGPATISCVSSDRTVEDLYEEFQGDLTWEVGFHDPVVLRHFPREYPQFRPLFVNVKKNPIAFTLQIGKNELVVLPNIEDVEVRSRYIAYILNEFLPQFRPAWFPDRWTGSYTPAALEGKAAGR